ncbi:hypothetical protein SMCF_767, partial [Streptomyces coelicoflavus ZG0656]
MPTLHAPAHDTGPARRRGRPAVVAAALAAVL